MQDESNSHINDILDLIDRQLALGNVPISQRCFHAAIEFVTKFVIKIKTNGLETDDFKTDFYEKDWFKSLYNHIKSWYCDRYGEALKESTSQPIIGVVSLYDTPFKVLVPLTVRWAVEIPGKSAWFTIPNSVLEKEDVIEWLQSPPNLDSLSTSITERLYSELSHIGFSLRSINVNLMTADKENENIRGMASGIISHLQNAADDILKSNSGGVSYAFWELHLAVEKSIKVLLLQHGSQKHHHHNLHELFKKAKYEYGIEIEAQKLLNLPSNQDAIKYRYGEKAGTTSEYAIAVYYDVLDIVRETTKALKRKIIMNNASFLIQLPPWECNRTTA